MVQWRDEAIADPPTADDTAVKRVEDAMRAPLPPDFVAIARVHQGAAPVPARIDLPGGFGTAVSHLLHFEEEPGRSNLTHRRFPLEGVLDIGVFPFAEDVGGDLFCFTYRDDYDHPSVVFWSVDTGTVPLAATFSDFLALLHD